MSPPVESFDPQKLDAHLQYKPDGRRWKKQVKLGDCDLKELSQYRCELDGPPNDRRSRVVCEEVIRLFRQCANGLTIEVTSYEDLKKVE